MKKIFFITIVIILHSNITFSQKNFEIELSEGFIFFDYFGNEPKGFDNIFAGYGLQTEFNIWKNIYNTESLDLKFGIGITNYYYLNSSNDIFFIYRDLDLSNYINIKLGIDYKPKWSKISFLINSTNYFLLNKQQYYQNRWFNNVDLGIRIKLYKKLKLSFWSPVTLRPTHKGDLVYRPLHFNYDPWIEITGLNLGISYSFGGKKE